MMLIRVYILSLELSGESIFWHKISLKMLIFLKKIAKNQLFGPKILEGLKVQILS